MTRFIPARAGNTGDGASVNSISPVHPRSRGEYTRRRVCDGRVSGSSPLARGIQYQQAKRENVKRFIPARAGNTSTGTGCRSRRPVHPRSRGEYGQPPAAVLSLDGSSPLARGIPDHVGRRALGGRFIPARAGNTAACRATASFRPVHPRSRGEYSCNKRQCYQSLRSLPQYLPKRIAGFAGFCLSRRRHELHQRQPIEVARLAAIDAGCLKGESGVRGSRPCHDCGAATQESQQLTPDTLSDLHGVDADVHASAYFREPQ